MPTAWHPVRWWNVCMSEDEKKKWIQRLLSNSFNVYNLRGLKSL